MKFQARPSQCRKAYTRFPADHPLDAVYAEKRTFRLLAAVLASFLIVSTAFAGELRIANASASAEQPARRVLEKATKEQPWQNSPSRSKPFGVTSQVIIAKGFGPVAE